MMKKTILVTGGAGFIGSHQTEYLIRQGFSVNVLDNFSTGSRDYLHPEAKLFEGTIEDKDICLEAAKGCAGIIHLAAMSRVGPSMDVPELCIQANVNGTLNMLLAAKTHNISSFVYAASSSCYGMQRPPHHLDLKCDCLNPYAASKYMGEILVENFTKSYGMSGISLRYFNVYGSRQPGQGPYALVLGIFLDRIAKGLPLEVHGDGQQRRDFVHVSDIVRCNTTAMEYLWKNPKIFHSLNVGSGTNISIIELAQMMSDQIQWGPRRAGDALETLADISKTAEILGWTPQMSFQEGLKQLSKETKRLAHAS